MKKCADFSMTKPLTVVSSDLSKARSVSRDSLLSRSNVKESVRKVPLILDFNSYNKKVMSIVRRNFEQYLTDDVDIGKMFDSNFLGSFIKEKSFANHLVSSRLSAEYEIPGTFQCNRSAGNTCAYVSSATVIVGPFDTFDIRQSISCTSDNIVYCIFCSKCDYIGETGRRLGDRFREHLNDIKHKRIEKSEIARHFNSAQHTCDDANVVGLLHCKNIINRKQYEKNIINKLGTLVPLGMNKDDQLISSF